MKTSKLRLISYLFIVIIVALFSLNTVNIKSLIIIILLNKSL